MRAGILAAGVGSRLRPLTNDKPKCLVKVAGTPIIEWQLKSMIGNGIDEIFIVTGHLHHMIASWLGKSEFAVNVKLIENTDYEGSNNSLSAFLLRPYLDGHPFLLCNGDVVLTTEAVRGLLQNEREDLVLIDSSFFDIEAMKVTVNNDGSLETISKEIRESQAFAVSLDHYKFGSHGSEVFFHNLSKFLGNGHGKHQWVESALNEMVMDGQLKLHTHESVGPWVEVDNNDDLALADKIFSNLSSSLPNIRLALFDIDGTLLRGEIEIPGASEAVCRVRKSVSTILFMSNNSSMNREEHAERLCSLGIQCNPEEILLSTDHFTDWAITNQISTAYVLGTRSLVSHLEAIGIQNTSEAPRVVLVGNDTESTFEKLAAASVLISSGTPYYATHQDAFCPVPNGIVPDAGSFIKLLESTTGYSPSKVFGKPSVDFLQTALNKVAGNLEPSEVAVIGDRLETDIEMANLLGCRSVLVLSGATNRLDLERSELQADLVLGSVAELIRTT